MNATATAAPPVEAQASPAMPEEWTPSGQGWTARIGVMLALLLGLLWITSSVQPFWADRFALAAVWAIIGLSLNIVMGYTGQVSLGHHGFIGIAAFVAAYYVTEQAGCNPVDGCSISAFGTATVIAILSGGLSAGLLGLVALRIKGLYLALITLAYGFMAETSIFELPALTGGGGGMPAPRPDGFTSDRAFMYLCFIFLALAIYVDWRFVKSKVGRAVISIKNSEAVAASYGINVTSYKVLAFVLSGMFAGLAGSLFAFQATNVVANNFQFATALLWVLMVVVGGLGRRVGVVVASIFFALFPFLIELWESLAHFLVEHGRILGHVTIVVGSGLAIVTIVLYPGGLAEQLSPITRWLSGKRFSLHGEDDGPPPESPLVKLGLKKAADSEDTSLAAVATAVEQPVAKAPAPVAQQAREPKAATPAAAPAKRKTAPPAAKLTRPAEPAARPPVAAKDMTPADKIEAAVDSAAAEPKRGLLKKFARKRSSDGDADWAASVTAPPAGDPLAGLRSGDKSAPKAPAGPGASADPNDVQPPDIWGALTKDRRDGDG